MRTIKTNHFPFLSSLFIACLSLTLISCSQSSSTEGASNLSLEEPPEPPPLPPGLVEVTARGLKFEAPDSIPSGWTTFRFNNATEMTHLAFLYRVPEGRGVKDQQRDIAPVFQNIMDQINGSPLSMPEAGMEPPEWFSQIVLKSGPGLLSPREVGETTLLVEPGTYILECYVKTNGVFHSFNAAPDAYGMVHEFQVTAEQSSAPEPTASISISLSGEEGMTVEGATAPGEHIVAVTFKDQKAHENFVGHDVHLVQLAEDTDMEALATWMDWSQPTGMEDPAPARFLGGANELPAGGTAYFKVTLEPGDYAWIAEVPDPKGKGMLVPFKVDATL